MCIRDRCGPARSEPARARRRHVLPVGAGVTRYPLRRLQLRPGEEHGEAVSIELEPFDLGGLRYLPVPHEVEAALTVVQATTGLDLRLAFDAVSYTHLRAHETPEHL